MFQQSHSVTAVVVGKDRKGIYLVRRADLPVWVLPGGAVDPGELPSEAILREVQEECGFKARILKKVALYIPSHPLTNHCHLFLLEKEEGEAALSSESSAVGYFEIGKLDPLTPVPADEMIARALEDRDFSIEEYKSVGWLQAAIYLLSHPIMMGRFLWRRAWG